MERLRPFFKKAEIIDPVLYRVNLGGFPIGMGTDSWVYEGTDPNGKPVAVKIFPKDVVGQIGIPELQIYQKITRKAALFLNGQPVSLHKTRGGKDDFIWFVNPITRIGTLKSSGEASSVNPFIEGPTLERETDSDRYDLAQTEEFLEQLSIILNRRLGTKAIDVVPVNIKITGNNILAITDLCAQLQRLRKEKV